MTAPPLLKPVDLRLDIETQTEDGPLRVAARYRRGRWAVAAHCGSWLGLGLGADIRRAVDAALEPYAAGVAVDGWHGDGS